MSINIYKMDLSDFNNIKSILTSEFDDYWNENILREELLSSSSHYFVAKNENQIIGFAGFKIIVDEADIMNIVVKKDFRKQGVGTLLLKSLITFAKKSNLTSLTLEVNEENEPAISLYNKFGFQNIGLRNGYYNGKDAIIMRKNLI